MFNAVSVRIALLFAGLVAGGASPGADLCPAPPRHVPRTAAAIAADDHLISFYADTVRYLEDEGRMEMVGHVTVHQDERDAKADAVTYDSVTGRITVKGAVDFEDPRLSVHSDTGQYDQVGAASFGNANFQLLDRNGRGTAGTIDVSPAGRLDLEAVHYTTCPAGNEDWLLKAKSIRLDTVAQAGVARDVTMDFKGVPIFYTPYLSFPLGDARKSGFLFPALGHTGDNGFQVGAPYYFNLAPNYDLTLTPEEMTSRGVQLGGEFRYLTAGSRGMVEATYMPDDIQTHAERSYLHITDVTDLRRDLRVDVDIAKVSDNNYFQNFAVGSDETSVTFLERRAEMLYQDDAWQVRGQLQNFQTIDTNVLRTNRPYARVPRFDAAALWPIGTSHFDVGLTGEAVNFQRDVGPSGVRLDVSPELRWSLRNSAYFLEPEVGWHLTQYELQNAGFGNPGSPSRSVPYGRIDMGLIFERDAGSGGQRTQTLEPRLVYNYVPYRNQDELPVFDTALPDLNLTELFRTNRYVGNDRIGDANQISVGVTTRLFNQATGQQYLSATLGQLHYFTAPLVTLPCETVAAAGTQTGLAAGLPSGTGTVMTPAAIGPSNYDGLGSLGGSVFTQNLFTPLAVSLPAATAAAVGTACQSVAAYTSSDYVAQIQLTAYKNFSVKVDYDWNPDLKETEKSETSIQYRPDSRHVINLGYRYQRGIQEQWDGSFAWPIMTRWNAVGRLVYSILDKQTIEQVAGFEYRSCCWKIQIVERRYVERRFGDVVGGIQTLTSSLNTSYALQLELIGLSSVGKSANSFLERSIGGYSAGDSVP